MTVLVETLGGGAARESAASDRNGPGVETLNARLEQVGPLLSAQNVPANQAATALLLVGNADHNALPVGRAGTIVGLVVRANAVLTAGKATYQVTLNGTNVGTPAVLDGAVAADTQKKVQNMAAPVAFAKGDVLAVTLATNAGYLPVTLEHQAWFLVRWDPTDNA